MSRPVLPPDQAATAVVKLRVRARQKSAWVRAAQRARQTLSAWLSQAADEKAGPDLGERD